MVWQDKRKLIAQSIDNLGDQSRPAMRAWWLSYIRRAYPEDKAADAGPVMGEGILVVDDWVYAAPGRYKQRSPVMLAVGRCNWPVICNEFQSKKRFFVLE